LKVSVDIFVALLKSCSAIAGPWQVKVAEHVLTGHKVAIKILNRKKIQSMDMEEKGMHVAASGRAELEHSRNLLVGSACRLTRPAGQYLLAPALIQEQATAPACYSPMCTHASQL
jgi:hypothetical protein